MDSRRFIRCVLFFACVASLLVWSATARAEERGRKQKARKVSGWGQLGQPVKGSEDFYEITYYKRTGKKTGSTGRVKVKKTRAFLKITSKTLLYEDRRIPMEQLKPDEDLRIFGKPVSRQVPNRGGVGRGGVGQGGVDSQIQNARVVLSADLHGKLPFDSEFKDPRYPEHKWLDVQVTKNGGGLWVKSLGVDNRVTMAKGAPILKRRKVEPGRLKSRLYVQFFAWTTSDRPDTGKKSDASKDSFRASMIVILDRRSLASVYPMMWKR